MVTFKSAKTNRRGVGRPPSVYRQAWHLWKLLVQQGRLEQFISSSEWHRRVEAATGVKSASGIYDYTRSLKEAGLVRVIHGGFFVSMGFAFGPGECTINPDGMYAKNPDGEAFLLLTPDKLPEFTSWEAWKLQWEPKTADELVEAYAEERNNLKQADRDVDGLNGAWQFYSSSFPPGEVVEEREWRIRLAVAEHTSVLDDELAQLYGASSADERFRRLTKLAAAMGLVEVSPDRRVKFLYPPRPTLQEPEPRPRPKRLARNYHPKIERDMAHTRHQ